MQDEVTQVRGGKRQRQTEKLTDGCAGTRERERERDREWSEIFKVLRDNMHLEFCTP